MKTFCQKIKHLCFSFVLAGCFLFLNSSCGLDEYYVLDNPTVVYTNVLDVEENQSKDYTNNFVSFATNEEGMIEYIDNPASSFVFEGTEIYYKIYNNYSTYNSEKNSLYALSSSDNYSSAATRLIETSGYHFLPLACENYNTSPMIPAAKKNQKVYIRLTDYGTEAEWAARIEIDGVPITGTGKSSQPRRNGDVGAYSFNFGRDSLDSNLNKIPGPDDADTKYDSSKDNFFYVSLYAVAVGRDANYARYYSNILHLGTITIDASSENN